MLKPKVNMQVGDWVLNESIYDGLKVGHPWKVSKLSGDRVYLERFMLDSETNLPELSDEKFVARKSVLYVFDNEESAKSVYKFTRDKHREFKVAVDAFTAIYDQAFHAYLAEMPVNLTPPTVVSPEPGATAKKSTAKVGKHSKLPG
jgi:hypothetical protein